MKLVLLLLMVGGALAFKSYEGYQVLRTAPVPLATLQALNLLRVDPRFDFWSQPREGRPVDILVPPTLVNELHNILVDLELQPTVHLLDIQKSVEKERAEIASVRKTETKSPRDVTFDRFMDFDEIQAYLDELVATYPELASLIDLGLSYEGRPIRVLKISSGVANHSLFLDSALHAREWIGPPVSLYSAYQLLENYAANRELIDLLDWYILPVANPDGYTYSWTDDRFWRKTRSPNNGTVSDCDGTDPNRNFDFHWGEASSDDPCSLTYHGLAPFSEVEVKAIGDFIREKGSSGEMILYMALHSYGSTLLYPYGYTSDLPPNNDDLISVGEEAAEAVQGIRGTTYIVKNVASGGSLISGSSMDYAMGAAGIRYAYTWELPAGGSGFDPPPTEIRPVVIETWVGIVSLALSAVQN